MTKGGSKYMKIKISTEMGKVVKVVDEKGNKASELPASDLQQIYQTQAPTHIGEILYTHSSPGCIIVHIGGKLFKICF